MTALQSFLRSEGKPVPLSALGSKVKKPPGVEGKLKAFIVAHSQVFSYDDQSQNVSLASK